MKTNLQFANETLAKILALSGESVGVPSHGGTEIKDDLRGVAPAAVLWSEDRGNWAWDGALAAFQAFGIDIESPLTD